MAYFLSRIKVNLSRTRDGDKKVISPSTHKEHTANGAMQGYRKKQPLSQAARNDKRKARHWLFAIVFPGMH